ncbi:MAG: MarR family transcriptional regulator [Leptospira sp.]|nr:MarR family transcriptional regulator [Leptospira sp.]
MDAIDKILKQWKNEIPDLSLSGMEVFGRIGQVALRTLNIVEKALEPFDLKLGEFDVLASLRRSGTPYELNPTQLWQGMLLSSGAMTNRLDRLEKKGLIERKPDEKDRRVVNVILTKKGFSLIEDAVKVHTENENRCLSSFNENEIKTLNDLLTKLMRNLENIQGNGGSSI